MAAFLPEFTAFAAMHILTLISPGPDFAMVVRSSLRYARSKALLVALGIASGELIHVTYSILGLGFVINESPAVLTIMKYVGGAYLVYIGFKSVRARKELLPTAGCESQREENISDWQAFRTGLLTNALNVKAAFFTLSIFTVIVNVDTSLWIKLFYGFFIFVSTFLWFMLVALFLTSETVQQKFYSSKHWLERVTGAVLMILGFQLAIF